MILKPIIAQCKITLLEDEPTEPESPILPDEDDEKTDEEEKTTTTTIVSAITTDSDDPDFDYSLVDTPRGVLWSKVWMILRLVSAYTCWNDSDQDTFITQTRTQRVNFKQYCCHNATCGDCNRNIITIPLDYAPLADDPFVGAPITVVNGAEIRRFTIPADYLEDHYDNITQNLYIDAADYPQVLMTSCCKCPGDVSLAIEYNAGYDTIPLGILPFICALLNRLDKMSATDCHATMNRVAGVLASKKIGNVQYQWTDNTSESNTDKMIIDLFNTALISQLQTLSRCTIVSSSSPMGFVV